MPDDSEWQAFEDRIRSQGISVMFWEDTPLESITKKLSELGVLVVVFNPSANRPESGDFLDAMRENLRQWEDALNQQTT